MDDLISRHGTMDEISKLQTYKMFEGEDTVYLDANDVGSVIASMPSAQPEVLACGEGELSTHLDDAALHESCTDCPLYDHDKHRCPRFNKVIPTTIQDILDTQTQRWIPVKERLPEARQSVILSTENWTGEGCYWETTEYHVIWKGYRWKATYWDDEVIAWMPLPEPARLERD